MSARIMTDPGLIDDAVRTAAGGAGLGGGAVAVMFLVRWFITFMAGRADMKEDRLIAQASELDTRWKEYRETLERDFKAMRGELSAVRQEVERCHAEKRSLESRVAELEGFATGRGKAVQIGQVELSADRIFKDKGAAK
jgi:predicted nuclease with TOPRIM domain